ncbi:MAG: TraM recognition domain-containing protein, partial [Dehalococcoidia bacterium]|nr:TraM recognition domain-containing protein [Dehalococcoidia bacterium]
QVALPPGQRSRLVALVDESSTLGAADYPRMLSELGKYGASFVLVTQSLAKLDAIDEALRPTLFSNIDGLMVFQVSAQDARYLAPELGNDLDVPDLTALDDFECYARWWADGRRIPTFSLRLDRPPPADYERLKAVVEASAERYGRPRDEVTKEIEAVLAHRGEPVRARAETPANSSTGAQGTEEALVKQEPVQTANPKQKPPRNQHRGQRVKK